MVQLGTDIVVEPDAGEVCAKACAMLHAELSRIRHHEIPMIANLMRFSDRDSGAALAERFNRAAAGVPGSLAAALDRHLAIVDDLFHRFIAAGKLYERQEQISRDAIARASHYPRLSAFGDQSIIGTDVPVSPYAIDENGKAVPLEPGARNRGNDLQQRNGQAALRDQAATAGDAGVTVLPESPAVFSEQPGPENPLYAGDAGGWNALYYLADSIDERRLERAGVIWERIADGLSSAFGDFKTSVAARIEQNWQGPGGDAATRAATSYADDSDGLVQAARLVGENLKTTGVYFGNFRTTAPAVPFESLPDPDETVNSHLQTYIRNYYAYYAAGITQADGNFPRFPTPVTPISGPIPAPRGDRAGSPAGVPGSTPATAPPPAAPPTPATPPPNLSAEPVPRDPDKGKPDPVPGVPTCGPDPTANPDAPDPGTPDAAASTPVSSNSSDLPSQLRRLADGMQPGATGPATNPYAQTVPAAAGGPGTGAKSSGGGGTAGGGGAGGGKAAGGGGAAGGIGAPRPHAPLFPRASVPGLPEAVARAGVGTGSPGAPGMPGSPAGAGAGAGQGADSTHKRRSALDSQAHLDEAIGEPPLITIPVIDR